MPICPERSKQYQKKDFNILVALTQNTLQNHPIYADKTYSKAILKIKK